MKKLVVFLGAVLWLNFGLTQTAGAMILINEVLADPPAGIEGDANQDGARHSADDEFVELYNSGAGAVNLSGWTLYDSASARHVFPDNTFLDSGEMLVVFGGGAPDLSGVFWQTASSGGLGLNNSGDTVSLFDGLNLLATQFVYGPEGGEDQALVLSPEGSGPEYIKHLELANAGDARFSPGNFVNPVQTADAGNNTVTTPEPLTMSYLGLGFSMLYTIRGRNRRGRGV